LFLCSPQAEGTLIDAEAASAQAERKIGDATAAKAAMNQLWEYIESQFKLVFLTV
jgi:hypothetical protein